jgi:hypothetical protein
VTTLLRTGLRTTTVFVVALTGWLVSVIVGVLPERDPSSIGLWTVVAAASGVLAAAALAATMRREPLGGRLGGALGLLSLAALAFGLIVLTSLGVPGNGRHFEGYLLLVGLILGLEGAFGLGWLASLAAARR